MKTITHKGKVYEINKLYGSSAGIKRLSGYIEDSEKLELHGVVGYTHHNDITEIKIERLGTIKDAPIELEDGEWYKFVCGGHVSCGEYIRIRNAFFNCDNKVCGAGQAEDIRLMKEL